jgi:hypothetical protein
LSLTQTTVMQDLSYLLGETSVPSTGTEDRQRFIQLALERAYRAYDFPFNKVTATVAMVNGIASLPANVHQDSILDARVINSGVGNDYIFDIVPYSTFDNYSSGTYKARLTGYEGAYLLTSSETSLTNTLTLFYETTAPVITASITTPFPSSMALARGALIYLRQAEDPQADISQEEALFQLELDEVISQYNRSRPQPRGITMQEAQGTYTGDITNSGNIIDA